MHRERGRIKAITLAAAASGLDERVVYVAALILIVAAMGGKPSESWRMGRHGVALDRHRKDLGAHTYVSFIYKPPGRSARSPLDMAATLQQQGELVSPDVARAATEAHVRLYRRYGFEVIEDAPTISPADRPCSRLKILRTDLPAMSR